jgi:uncharacterized membrane protein YdjX (TVP38/TMEM64 family)
MDPQARRLVILTLVILALWIAAWATGLTGRFTTESIRGLLTGSGLWGLVTFNVLFAVGQLLVRVPSPVFVAAAVAVWGRNIGIVVALLGAVLSATSVSRWYARSQDSHLPMFSDPVVSENSAYG